VEAWVAGLPQGPVVIISLLGWKPTGQSEFGFYSFRGAHDSTASGRPTFQDWLVHRYGMDRFEVLEYPTVDTESMEASVVSGTVDMIRKLLSEGRTVVVMDSGGVSRSGKVARAAGFRV
jgi:protein-tyrosine phosphatase